MNEKCENDNDILLDIYRELLSLKTAYGAEHLKLSKDNDQDIEVIARKTVLEVMLYSKIQSLNDFLDIFDKHINLHKEIILKDEDDHLNENTVVENG